MLDPNTNPKLLPTLNPNIALVALNISRGDITLPFGNFHDARSEATDYKIRYATNDTPLWGAYMTDIIKDFEEKISGKVKSYLRENRDFEKENVDFFVQELSDIGATNPTLIAFGNESYDILKRNLNNEFKISRDELFSSLMEILLSFKLIRISETIFCFDNIDEIQKSRNLVETEAINIREEALKELRALSLIESPYVVKLHYAFRTN